jgi:hypothetical protein
MTRQRHKASSLKTCDPRKRAAVGIPLIGPQTSHL